MRTGESLVPMSEDRLRSIFNEGSPNWVNQNSKTSLKEAEIIEYLDTPGPRLPPAVGRTRRSPCAAACSGPRRPPAWSRPRPPCARGPARPPASAAAPRRTPCDALAGARERGMVGGALVQAVAEELAQGEAVADLQGDAAFGVEARQVAEQQHAEVRAGGQRAAAELVAPWGPGAGRRPSGRRIPELACACPSPCNQL